MVLKAPISTVKGLWRYRWMASYLSAPSFIDRHVAGLRGPQLRMAHLHYNMIVKHTTNLINISFRADEKINPNNKLSRRIVLMDEIVYKNIYMNLPSKKLCKNDCKGLCPKCGKNLNEGDCGCDTREADPRFDALDKFFK